MLTVRMMSPHITFILVLLVMCPVFILSFYVSTSSFSTRPLTEMKERPKGLILHVSDEMSITPFFRNQISDTVKYKNDLYSSIGVANYKAVQSEFLTSTLPGLANAKFSVNRISQLEANCVLVHWNVTFVSESTEAIALFFQTIPGVRLRFFDLLHKLSFRSSFSWLSLFKTFQRLIETGELILPHAVILGSSELRFSSTNEEAVYLVSQVDSLSLIRQYDQGILKNRKIFLDLLEFVDRSRPPFIDLDSWDDIVRARIIASTIPGIGQFDIDGLEGSQDENIKNVSNTFLKLAIPLILASFLFSTLILNGLLFGEDAGVQMMSPLF